MFFPAIGISSLDPALNYGALIIGLGLGIIFHEVAHGYAALLLGDPTAKYAGRLSLNPLRHVDLLGTIVVPLFLIISQVGFVFGWAKPVPVNYYNLRHGKYGPALVSLAGPGTNLFFLVVFSLLARFSPSNTALPYLFITIAHINSLLMFFNLIPVPPLDGSKILFLFLDNQQHIIQWLEKYGWYILLALLIFGDQFFYAFVFRPATQIVQYLAGGIMF